MLKTKIALFTILSTVSLVSISNENMDIQVRQVDALKALNEIKAEQAKSAQLDFQKAQVKQKMMDLASGGESSSAAAPVSDTSTEPCFKNIHGDDRGLKADIEYLGRTFKGVSSGSYVTSGLKITSISFVGDSGSVQYSNDGKKDVDSNSCFSASMSSEGLKQQPPANVRYATPLR